jgi:KUP system potassium uptake protein
MLLTTCLLFVAMREIWAWSLAASLAVAGCFFVIDATFVAANSLKILEGGWIPLALAALVFFIMATWHVGVSAITEALRSRAVPVAEFLADIKERGIPRVPGTAVFLTRSVDSTPPVLLWHVRNNRALHSTVVALNVQIKPVPWINPAARVAIEQAGENFWRMSAQFGFMERPDIPKLIAHGHEMGCTLHLDDVTYYLGHETVLHRTDGHGLPLWREAIFAFMLRNSTQSASFFNLPREGVVEIGRQVEI